MQAQRLFATPPLSRHASLPPHSPIVHDIFSLKLPTCSSKTKRITGGSSSGTQVKRAHTRSCPESDRTKSIVKLISPAESKEEDFLDTWRSVGRCGPVIFWSDRGGWSAAEARVKSFVIRIILPLFDFDHGFDCRISSALLVMGRQELEVCHNI